ncbi:hypothetical protein DL546_004990 [Coniochaeta pulveracea]|uniref:C3HC-type domain-containing protein n=1 Tax=Coniochaeta pulveracea TaxID=177199 RepID=A0A420YMQ3_9PEZI|nr:hypothetical protein DL546_004990 [Coniochaeta pulveracea]
MNATVKRKYNDLIQSISSRPAAVPSTTERNGADENDDPEDNDPSSIMASDFGFLAKKRRVDTGASSTLAKYGSLHNTTTSTPQANGPTTISNITLRKWTPTGAASPASTATTGTPFKDTKTQPRYCPGDRDQLIKRLATFQELTEWTPKPDRVNEIEWAKRGWVCQGKERVRCTLCNKELVVKLNKKEVDGKEVTVIAASEVTEALVQKYAELIVQSHSEDCLWRKRGCDDSLLRLPLAHPKTALTELRLRYDELYARKDFLPYEFNLRLPESLDVDTVLSYLPSDFFTNPPPSQAPASDTRESSSTPSKPAFALALLGWQGLTNPRIGAVPNSASCHTCLRRLGLWMFKSKEINPETNEVLVPAPMDHLDPLREHRFFCPWKNGAVQRNPGAKSTTEEPKAGWEILVQVLKNDAFLRSHAEGGGRSHARSKSSVVPGTLPPSTPARPGTAGGTTVGVEEDEEDEATRSVKDKERWARLRRVKSLFNPKSGSIRKRLSRPGTSGTTDTPDRSRAATPATPSRPAAAG